MHIASLSSEYDRSAQLPRLERPCSLPPSRSSARSSTARRTSSADSRPSGCGRSSSPPWPRHPAWSFLAIALPFIGGAWSPADVAWGVLAGAFGVVAIALLYACLAIGPMSILSPLTAVVSAIAPMLWGLFVNGETLSPIGYAGLGVALVAVVLVGFIPGEKVVRPSDARPRSWPSGRDSRSARSSS